jgi:hypothetical protein
VPTEVPASADDTPHATGLATHVADPSAGASSGTAEPGASDEPFPNPNEQLLIAHMDATVQPTCERADQFYADEVDSISCGGDPTPYIDYTLFASVDELRAAFNDDVQQSESPPVASGTCASANYQSTYELAGAAAGRIQCTTRSVNGQLFKVIEWTRDSLRILAYLTSASSSWKDLIAFWKSHAGPTG